MKKRHSFILFELLIALSILSSFAIPMMSSRFIYMKMEKKWLLQLEKERIAEKLFYTLCTKLTEKHPLERINRTPHPIYLLNHKKVTIDLGYLKSTTFYVHYHLYSMSTKTPHCKKIFCKFCFNEKDQKKCNYAHNDTADYLFIFSGENLSKINHENKE